MNIPQLLINPTTISFLTTFQCTAKCRNCCFGCNPQIKVKLSLEEMKLYINQAIMYYGESLKVLVLTGGECFLLNDDLIEIIKYGASKKLIVRVVTNGYWAKTYQEAYEIIFNLRENGLQEINFSTGGEHQEWVPYDYIVNGCMASMDLGLLCCVNIETHDKSKISFKTLQTDSRLAEYFNVLKFPNPLIVNEGVWIPFRENSNISYDHTQLRDDNVNQKCSSILNTLVINPYSQLISCCGLTSEYIKPLRLGSLKERSMKELYEMQFYDLLKIWLYVDGPHAVLRYLYEKRGIKKDVTGHICYVCAEIFKDSQNIQYIKNNYQEIMPSVMFKYFLIKINP